MEVCAGTLFGVVRAPPCMVRTWRSRVLHRATVRLRDDLGRHASVGRTVGNGLAAHQVDQVPQGEVDVHQVKAPTGHRARMDHRRTTTCLLYTSDAADEEGSVDLDGRCIT